MFEKSTLFTTRCINNRSSGAARFREVGVAAPVDIYLHTSEDNQANLVIQRTNCRVYYALNTTVRTAVVTCEIKLFRNYFRSLFQLMNNFPDVQCR